MHKAVGAASVLTGVGEILSLAKLSKVKKNQIARYVVCGPVAWIFCPFISKMY